MAGNERPTPLSKRQERILRAILPIGLAYLVLWVGWVAFLVLQPDGSGVPWVSGAIGLVTSMLLIALGLACRRDLDRRQA